MAQNNTVLCGSNAYHNKFYFNPKFSGLPEGVQQELQIICVLFTEEIGGIVILEYEEDGALSFRLEKEENDFFYDDIGSALKIKRTRHEKRELFEALELYYKMFFLKQK